MTSPAGRRQKSAGSWDADCEDDVKKKAGKKGAGLSERHIAFRISPENYREIAEKQRARLHTIADKIERGEPLTEWESSRAAERLHLAADLIETKQSKKGRQPKICQGTVALEFWMLVNERGMSKNAAREELAGRWDCSTQTIKNAMKKYADAALHLGWWIREEGESK